MSEWQTIETAPKNYASVLLYEPGRYLGQGHWSNHIRCWLYDSPTPGGQPTHWMPLPDPPATQPVEEGQSVADAIGMRLTRSKPLT
jgi:hypothetical protein